MTHAHALSVGQPYGGRSQPVPPGARYVYADGHHELMIALKSPTPREVDAVQRGVAEFAMYDGGAALFLLAKFGGMPWVDAPYTPWLIPATSRVDVPRLAPNERALITTSLVDADTGVVRAVRALSVDPNFTRYLYETIRDMKKRPWLSKQVYDEAIRAVYQLFPNSAGMVGSATVRSIGGE